MILNLEFPKKGSWDYPAMQSTIAESPFLSTFPHGIVVFYLKLNIIHTSRASMFWKTKRINGNKWKKNPLKAGREFNKVVAYKINIKNIWSSPKKIYRW